MLKNTKLLNSISTACITASVAVVATFLVLKHMDTESGAGQADQAPEHLTDSQSIVLLEHIEQLHSSIDLLQREILSLRTSQAENADIMEKLTFDFQKIKSAEFAVLNQYDIVEELTDIDQQLSYENVVQARELYSAAEDQFYNEGFDSNWDARMSLALSDIESRITNYSNDGIVIKSQECRSNSCRVEFEVGLGTPLIHPVMLATTEAPNMHFDSSKTSNGETLTVIYQK